MVRFYTLCLFINMGRFSKRVYFKHRSYLHLSVYSSTLINFILESIYKHLSCLHFNLAVNTLQQANILPGI